MMRRRRNRHWLAGYAAARGDMLDMGNELEHVADQCRHHALLIVGEIEAWESNQRSTDAKR